MMGRRSPFGDGVADWKDGSRSFSMPLVPNRWWIQYIYSDSTDTDPVCVRIAHVCPKEPEASAYFNTLPMEDITGPGVTYLRNIVCNNCGDLGMLDSGRWLSLNPGITDELLPVQGQPVDLDPVTEPDEEEWVWYHSFFEDGEHTTKMNSKGAAFSRQEKLGGYVFRARPQHLIRTEPEDDL